MMIIIFITFLPSTGMAIQVEYNPHVTADASNAFSQQDTSGLSSFFDVPVDQNITDTPVANMNNSNNSGSIMTTSVSNGRVSVNY